MREDIKKTEGKSLMEDKGEKKFDSQKEERNRERKNEQKKKKYQG